jgi:hypothetical protein
LISELGVLAIVSGLFVGALLGRGRGFSWKGCVLGGILSYPILGYAYYVLALQFLILQQWGGDETAYLGFVLLGMWIGSALGLYRGLRKARRKGWAAIVSPLVILVPILLFWATEVMDLRSAYIYLGDSEVPVPYAVPATLPPSCPHVEARITSPGVNAVLRGVVQIRGTADIRYFQFYKVELGAGDKPWTWSVIGDDVVRKRVVDDVLVTWDTSKMPPGVYTLQLTVVDVIGNYPSPCKVKVSVVR